MAITANQVIEKRKEIWEQYHDPNKDFEYVLAVANELIENASLLKEVIDNPELLIEMTFTIVDKTKSTVPFCRRVTVSGTRSWQMTLICPAFPAISRAEPTPPMPPPVI